MIENNDKKKKEMSVNVNSDISNSTSLHKAHFEWMEMKKKVDSKFNVCVLNDVILAVGLDTFYKSFVSDGAEQSIAKHQINLGDFDVHAGPWEKCELDKDVMVRTITYNHPLVLGSAQTIKEQKLKLVETHGMFLSTTTKVMNVQVANNFVIEDLILIESTNNTELILNAYFRVHFTRETYFDGIIGQQINAEMQNWFQCYLKMIQKRLDTFDEKLEFLPSVLRKSSLVSSVRYNSKIENSIVEKSENSMRSQKYNSIHITFFVKNIHSFFIILLCLIIVQQYLMICQFKSSQNSFHSLQEQLIAIQVDNVESLHVLTKLIKVFEMNQTNLIQ